MNLKVNKHEISGTPHEIAEIIKLLEKTKPEEIPFEKEKKTLLT